MSHHLKPPQIRTLTPLWSTCGHLKCLIQALEIELNKGVFQRIMQLNDLSHMYSYISSLRVSEIGSTKVWPQSGHKSTHYNFRFEGMEETQT